MDAQRDPVPSQLFRLLVAADASVDPHRLIGLCCESAGQVPLAVSLLVAVDDLSGPGAEAGARAEGLLGRSATLLDAAGLRLEDFILAGGDGQGLGRLVRSGGFDALLVCAADDQLPSPVLPLAATLARQYGLPVLGDGPRLAATSLGWLRRVVDPLLRRQRPQERA